jgi:hypothetical protein
VSNEPEPCCALESESVDLMVVRELLAASGWKPEADGGPSTAPFDLADPNRVRVFVDAFVSHAWYPRTAIGAGRQNQSLVTARVRLLVKQATGADELPTMRRASPPRPADEAGLELVKELLSARGWSPGDAAPFDLSNAHETRAFAAELTAHPRYGETGVGSGKQDQSLVTRRVRALLCTAIGLEKPPTLYVGTPKATEDMVEQRNDLLLRIAARIVSRVPRTLNLRDRSTIAIAVGMFRDDPDFGTLNEMREAIAAARRASNNVSDDDRGLHALVRRSLARVEGLDPDELENMPRSGDPRLPLAPKWRKLMEQVPGRKMTDKVAVLLECADLDRIKRAAQEGRLVALGARGSARAVTSETIAAAPRRSEAT